MRVASCGPWTWTLSVTAPWRWLWHWRALESCITGEPPLSKQYFWAPFYPGKWSPRMPALMAEVGFTQCFLSGFPETQLSGDINLLVVSTVFLTLKHFLPSLRNHHGSHWLHMLPHKLILWGYSRLLSFRVDTHSGETEPELLLLTQLRPSGHRHVGLQKLLYVFLCQA